MNTPNSPANEATTPPNTAPEARKPRRLRIGEREIKAMCECLAVRMTERESCQVLGIEERTWYRWKSHARNSERLSRFLDRITGEKIKTHIGNIEAGAVGAGPHKRADWRASQAILGIVAARYLPQQPPPEQPRPAVSAATVQVWISNGYGQLAEIVDAPEVKALPSPPAELKIADGVGRSDWNEPPPRPAREKCPPMFPSKLP